MTPRLWRLRQLIVSDLNTSTQTMLFVCFCVVFLVLSSVSIFGGGTSPIHGRFPSFDLFLTCPPSFTLDKPIQQMILPQSKQFWTRDVSPRRNLHFNYTEFYKNFRLLISSAVLANFVPPCSPFAQILQTSPSTFLLISIILRRLVTMQFFTSCA